MSVYTVGTENSLKPDSSGYHHHNNYELYMYAYKNLIDILMLLENTDFQVDKSAYLVFRDAIMHH